MPAETDGNIPPERTVGVAEAAEHFGISTLRIRHRLRTGALKGFRDNRGHWQVRLDRENWPEGDKALDRDALADMLIEELLEAQDRASEQEVTIERLRNIIERQQTILDGTIARLEASSSARLDTETAERLSKTLDRAIALLETSIDQQERANSRADRFRAMMARAIDLLEMFEPKVGAMSERSIGAAEALDKAIDFGGRAIKHAETSSHHAARLDGMLERALAVAEQKVEAQNVTEQRLARRDELLERSLGLIETATSRAADKPPKRGWWLLLFGRG